MRATEPTPASMSFADAARLDPDEQAGELDHGRWVPVTRITWRHGEVLINLGTLLRLFTRQNPGWSVSGGDPGTRLGKDPDVLRGPDLGVIQASRRPKGSGEAGWLSGAPDLAIEICGDDQTPSGLARKALEYLAAGSRMVWIVDGAAEQVMIYTPPNRVVVVGRDEVLDGGDALPGFSCRVHELFE